MEMNKCISCKNLFEKKKENKSIKVTLSNPGDVFCEGVVSTCPHCGETYVDEEDMIALAESFEVAHADKDNKYKRGLQQDKSNCLIPA